LILKIVNPENVPIVIANEPAPLQRTAGVFPTLCWSAIIGGTVAAIGIQILLSLLGVGAGLAMFAPMADIRPVAAFSEEAAATWTACALVALFFWRRHCRTFFSFHSQWFCSWHFGLVPDADHHFDFSLDGHEYGDGRGFEGLGCKH